VQQHEPSALLAPSTVPPVADSVQRGSPLRLLIAFALGLTAPFFFSPFDITPWWWQPAGAIVILLVAALLSLGSLVAGAVTIVVMGGLGAAFLVLRQMAEAVGSAPEAEPVALQWTILAAALVPVLVGLASALVVQRRHRSAPRALGGAALSWLVALLVNVIAAILSPNPEGFLTGAVLAGAVSIVGFAFALLGGGIGWLLMALVPRSTA
jgi:hypothetical protein